MLVFLRACWRECVFVPISTFVRRGISFQSNAVILISYNQ
jgi:hypothetical protein